MLKCIIVDDDLMSRTAMENLCKRAENLEVAASFTSAEDALQFLNSEQVNLIFLDIEMEITHWDEFDHVVVNRDFAATVAQVRSILHAARSERRRQPGMAGFIARLLAG